VKNPKRDFANGFLIAEIFVRDQPPERIFMHSFDNGTEERRRQINWEHLDRFFKKYDIPITKKDWEPVMYYAPNAAIDLIKKVYQIIVKKELITAPAVEQTKPPPYARPTAAQLLRTNGLQRVEDKKTKEKLALEVLNQHIENVRLERTEPGRLALPKQTTSIAAKTLEATKPEQTEQNIEVRQVAVKSMDKNLRAAKALVFNKPDQSVAKTQQESSKQNTQHDLNLLFKPVLEIMSEIFLEIMHQPQFKSVRIMDFRDVEHGEDLTREFYAKMEKLNIDFVVGCLENIQRRASSVADVLIKMEQEFELYSELILSAIEKIKADAPYFKLFIDSLNSIAETMSSIDEGVTEELFNDFLITPLTKLSLKNPHKTVILVNLLNSFSKKSPAIRYRYLCRLMDILPNYAELVKIIAPLVKFDKEYYEELHTYYKHYAILALSHSSPVVRTAGIAILGSIGDLNPEMILEEVHQVEKLGNDTWWEVKAQILRLSGIMLPLIPREKTETLYSLITSIFVPSASKNIIRIGLIYLAPVLHTFPELCEIYVECLLSLSSEERGKILDTEQVVRGSCVFGSSTQSYKLSGVPLSWNALGIASSLAKSVISRNLENLEYAHVDVLWACLHKPPNQHEWINVFDQLKNYIYVGLCDPDISEGVIAIAKHFLTAPGIMTEIIKRSKDTLIRSLNLLLTTDVDRKCVAQGYGFIKSLYWDYELPELQEFVFVVLKTFAEKYPVIFERSELLEIINEIIRHRRGDIFGEDKGEIGASSKKGSEKEIK